MAGRRTFNGLAEQILAEVDRDMFGIAEIVAVEAQISITAGSVSGKGHVPSSPGEPPQNDTGVLAGNIEVRRPAPLHAQIVSSAPYSRHLEFGTSRMAARPFLEPAAQTTRAEVRAKTVKAVNRAIRKFRRR